MRLRLNILVITLLALLSCAKESGERVRDDQGTGTLHVRFDIPANAGETKVDGVSEGVYTGTHNVLGVDNVIRSGRLLLVDKDGTVVAYRKAKDQAGVVGNGSGSEVITGINRGDYRLYVLVNATEPNELDNIFTVGSKPNIQYLLDKTMYSIIAGQSPTFSEESGIPCSYVTDVAITAGNNNVDVHLERCVGRLTIKVLNNIPDRKLAIRSIGLSDDNPVTGYYYPHDGSVDKVAFPDLTEMVELAPNENKTIFDHYVYETAVVNEGLSFNLFGAVYGENATVGFDEAKGTAFSTSLSPKGILGKVEPEGVFIGSEVDIPRERRPIKIVDKYGDAQLLQQIKRNEHVTVSINIFYNRELGQFDFKVSSWKEVSNETTFD